MAFIPGKPGPDRFTGADGIDTIRSIMPMTSPSFRTDRL